MNEVSKQNCCGTRSLQQESGIFLSRSHLLFIHVSGEYGLKIWQKYGLNVHIS